MFDNIEETLFPLTAYHLSGTKSGPTALPEPRYWNDSGPALLPWLLANRSHFYNRKPHGPGCVALHNQSRVLSPVVHNPLVTLRLKA